MIGFLYVLEAISARTTSGGGSFLIRSLHGKGDLHCALNIGHATELCYDKGHS